MKLGSQAELQEKKPILVTLAAHDWINKTTFELAVMFEKKRLITDIGYARLDMSRMPINFGSTDGIVHNGDHLTKVLKAAADAYLKPFSFILTVIDAHKEVRFSLSPAMPVKWLELSKYFETSRSTFEGVNSASVQALELPKQQAVAA